MMKTVRVLMVVLVGLALLAVTGCGCGKIKQAAEIARMANDARDGKMTVTNEKGEKATIETNKAGDKGGKITVTDEKGTTTTTEIGNAKVSEQEVGIAFYPGATVETSSASSTSGKESAKYSVVSLTSTDSFDQVAKFYKDKYAKGNTVMEQPNSLMITITAGKESGRMIMVTSSEGKVQIMIHAAAS